MPPDEARPRKRKAAEAAAGPRVSFSEAAGRWRATSADALELFLGWFATEKEASAAARKYSDAWRSRRN